MQYHVIALLMITASEIFARLKDVSMVCDKFAMVLMILFSYIPRTRLADMYMFIVNYYFFYVHCQHNFKELRTST